MLWEGMMTQSSLANGGDRVPSLISILAIPHVGVMTDLLLTDNPRPLRFLTPRVTGVPIDQCGLPLPLSPKLPQDARLQLSPRRVQG